MSNDNLLDKIKNKSSHRAKVEKQDPLLNNTEKLKITPEKETSENNQPSIQELEDQLSQFPNTQRRSGIVVDENINNQLIQFCRQHKITIETFLEASWKIAHQNPSFLNDIVDEAQIRYQRRKKAGQLKRLISSLKKLQ